MSPEEIIKNKMTELQNALSLVTTPDTTQAEKEALAMEIDGKLSTLFLDELLANIDAQLQQQGRGAKIEGLMQDLGNMLNISMKGMAQNPEESFQKVFQQVQVHLPPEEVARIYRDSCDKIITVLKTS